MPVERGLRHIGARDQRVDTGDPDPTAGEQRDRAQQDAVAPSLFTPTMASGAASSIAWKVDSPLADDVNTESNPPSWGPKDPLLAIIEGEGCVV